MSSRKKDFKEEDIIKALLWCSRHCCVCGKACGVAIEVAHIDANGGNSMDNAIPLCFECHQEIGHYNDGHPRGRKFRGPELRSRRDQIYEEYTSPLVPPLIYKLVQSGRAFPMVGFQIAHGGGPYPVRVRVKIELIQGRRRFGNPVSKTGTRSGHYDGRYLWNLNPGFGVSGHFDLPKEALLGKREPIRARIDVTVIDFYEREHKLLPIGYVNRLGSQDEWYLEPCEQELQTGVVEL